MKKNEFNAIGIESQLDWQRIAKLLKIGLFASCLVLIGDLLLGNGQSAAGTKGLEKLLSAYSGKKDSVYVWAGVLGLLGMFLEGLSYFGIYRLMAEKSPKHAHNLRTGIIGYVAFGACGVYIPRVMTAWLYQYLGKTAPGTAYDCCLKFTRYFILPAAILFGIFLLYMIATQISAFAKGMTPYPNWCWIFNMGFDILLAVLVYLLFGKYAWGNAVSAAWISIGNIWQFVGLLVVMKKKKLDQKEPAYV